MSERTTIKVSCDKVSWGHLRVRDSFVTTTKVCKVRFKFLSRGKERGRGHRPQVDGNEKESSGDLDSFGFDADYCYESPFLWKPRRHHKFV